MDFTGVFLTIKTDENGRGITNSNSVVNPSNVLRTTATGVLSKATPVDIRPVSGQTYPRNT